MIEREIITVDGMKVYHKTNWRHREHMSDVIAKWWYLECYSKNEPWFDDLMINTKYIVSLRPLGEVDDED